MYGNALDPFVSQDISLNAILLIDNLIFLGLTGNETGAKILYYMKFYLNSGFCKIQAHGQLFPGENIRVLSLLKWPLQLVQLEGGKSCSGPVN